MRVISGTARGRRLHPPPSGAATRPTSDKVREAIFNILGPAAVTSARVLDLFAGTGALGIEALSRGAARATFVDADRGLCETIRKNLDLVGFADRATVVCRDVRRARAQLAPGAPYDLVLIDPPYGHGLEREALAVLLEPALLADDAVVVVEHSSREPAPALPPAAPPGASAAARLEPERERVYGDTALTVYRRVGQTPETP